MIDIYFSYTGDFIADVETVFMMLTIFSAMACHTLKLLVVACNLRQRQIFISMLNWPRGSHSLFAHRGIVSSSIV